MPSPYTSLRILFFLVLMILGAIPQCHKAARILEDFSQNGGYSPPPPPPQEKDDQSKGFAPRGRTHDAGSATGDGSPTGSVQVPPSNTKTNLSYEYSNTSTPSGRSSYSRTSSVTTTSNSTSTPNSYSNYRSVQNTTVTEHNTTSRGVVRNIGSGQNGFNVPQPSFFPPAPPFPMRP